jgi:D-arabinose 1-dehydrogenase-like Zn-dependent alcohol dehydrogenase
LRITQFTQHIELLATKSRLTFHITSAYYRMLVKREARLADIREGDRVLCIGGGICPYTAILLHKYTGAHITVIDNNRSCVEKARKFVNRLGLDKIKILPGDGRDICCYGYTVIHLAMQITPKESVINEILSKAEKGTRVLVRKPKKSVGSLYCTMPEYEKIFAACVKHSLLSNVDQTYVCIVEKGAVGFLS